MNETTGSDTPDVYGALWIGALLLASGAIQDPFPASRCFEPASAVEPR